MRVWCTFTAFLVCLSDTAGDGHTPAGTAGLRHKLRHKDGGPFPPHPSRIPKQNPDPRTPLNLSGMALRREGDAFFPTGEQNAKFAIWRLAMDTVTPQRQVRIVVRLEDPSRISLFDPPSRSVTLKL